GRGKGQWTGDSSDQAATFMLVHDPRVAGQRPALTTATANQIGYYRPNGSVETASSAGADKLALPAQAAVLDHPALHNRVGGFPAVLPMNGLGSGASFQNLIAFQPII